MMDDWTIQAENAIKKLQNVNSQLESAIAEIKEEKKIATNVVAVIGYLDEALNLN